MKKINEAEQIRKYRDLFEEEDRINNSHLMTVADLIQILSKYPKDSLVEVNSSYGEYSAVPINHISQDDSGKIILGAQ